MESFPERTEVLVIGAGAVGLAAAYELLRSGREVVVVDRDEPGSGTSSGNCGLISPSYSDPLTQPGSLRHAFRSVFDPRAPLRIAPTLDPGRLSWLLRFALNCTEAHRGRARAARAALLSSSRDLLAGMIGRERIDCGWTTAGLTVVFRTQAGMAADLQAYGAAARIGLEFTTLTGDEARAREPLLSRSVIGGIHTACDAHLEPARFTRELARVVSEKGGRVITGTEVTRLQAAGDGVVRAITTRGTVRPDQIVLAAGPWAPRLARTLGLRMPIQPGMGYSITWPRPLDGIRAPLYFYEAKVAATPWPDAFRLGSLMEFSGYDERVDRRRIGLLVEGARPYLDHPLDLGSGREWFGWRPMSVDEIPILGRSSRFGNLQFCCGHGQLGMSQCAASGRLVSELMAGTAPHIDPAPYAPGRFGL